MMAGNDRATNGKSDSHTVILGCVERVEESVHNLRIETDPRIVHAQAHLSAFVWFSPDQQHLGRSSTPLIASDAFRTRFRMTC